MTSSDLLNSFHTRSWPRKSANDYTYNTAEALVNAVQFANSMVSLVKFEFH